MTIWKLTAEPGILIIEILGILLQGLSIPYS